MAFSEFEIARFDKMIKPFIMRKYDDLPFAGLSEIIYEYEGNCIIFKTVWSYPDKPGKTERFAAKGKHVKTSNKWRIYYDQGGGNWCPYIDPVADTFEQFLEIIGEDEMLMIWV